MRIASALLLLLLPQMAWAQAAPPIDATWFIGAPIDPLPAEPKHWNVAPDPGSEVPVVTASWLLPNVLVVSDADAIGADGKVILSAGAQLFQQSHSAMPVLCPMIPLPKAFNLCLVDSDSDGKLDSSVRGKLLLSFPRKVSATGLPLVKLATPISYHAVARETCVCKFRIDLYYIGRRKMFSKRDATFMTYIWATDAKGGGYMGDNIEFDMAKLPGEANILGATFANMHAEGKNLVFDLTSGFASAPYDVPDTARKIEWGF